MRIRNKHFCIVLLTSVFTCFNCYAIDFKAGLYYFDNSKLHFNHAKFVGGNDYCVTVIEMTPISDNRWEIFIEDDLVNLDGYCFIDSNIEHGEHYMSLNDFLDDLHSNEQGFRQTKVRNNAEHESNYLIGWVFYPLNDFEISDGYWRSKESYSVTSSGTLPIIHINTQNGITIADKENYIDGTLWIDNCNIEGYESLGNQAEPLLIQVKGRGNYSWRTFYKKPYKIKFEKKQSPLGLDNSKHFVLLPKAGDWSGYLRDETGFELSRQLKMPYTVKFLPVEVILNSDYMGLYFLGEKIRVESGRVDIMEQQDNETNPDNVSGGWLLENDWMGPIVNSQHEGNDPNNYLYAWSSRSPESLSQQQYNYIIPLLKRIDQCIFVDDKNDNSWENYIDNDCLARFYIIHEVMENVESFNGSLFMYKDWGIDEKFKFGPVWDFDNSYYHDATTSDHFFFEYDTQPYFTPLWIREILKFPHFQQTIRIVWKEFMKNNSLNKIIDHAWYWRSLIEEAEKNDRQRWRYASIHGSNAPAEFLDKVSRKVAWLDEQWRIPTGDVNADGYVTSADVTAIYDYLLSGDESFLSTSDINGDGHVTSADVTAIYDILLGNQ